MSGVTNQLGTLAFVLLTVQATKQLDMTDPTTLLIIRVCYATAQFIMLGLCFYIYRGISHKPDNTLLKVTEPAPAFSGAEAVTKDMTVSDYDMAELRKFIQQTAISLCLLSFLHYKYDYVQPLILQSILPFKNVWSMPLFKIHVLKKAAAGALKRPWKVANPFDFNAASSTPTPEASVTEEKKKGKKKDE